MPRSMPWFRVYTEIIDDEKVRLLAFEDRWHYMALLACKAAGILDGEDANLRMRKVAVKLGLDLRELGEVARRLAEVELICRESLQPLGWDERQFRSDSSAERTQAYRERMKRHRDVTVTPQDTDTDTDTEKKKRLPRVPRSAAPGCPPDVPLPLWNDWLAIRRAKKQPLTPTALEAIRREAGKAKLALADAVRMSVENGWAGFKHSWLLEAAARLAKAGAVDSSLKPWHETASGTKAMGAKFGLEPENFCRPDGTQDWQAFAAAVKKRAGVSL